MKSHNVNKDQMNYNYHSIDFINDTRQKLKICRSWKMENMVLNENTVYTVQCMIALVK